MPTEIDPIVDNWYYHLDKGQRFYVVAVDQDAGVVEIQHFDGDLEEISLDNWYDMDIALSEAPENWSGAMDIAEQDDLGTEITDTSLDDWTEPLQELRKPGGEKDEEESGASTNDWGEGYPEEEPLEDNQEGP